MTNRYNQYRRVHHSFSMLALSSLITFFIIVQGSIIVIAQPNQYQSVIASNLNINNNLRVSSAILNNDDAIYDNMNSDIYDDTDDYEEFSFSLSTTSILQLKSSHYENSTFPSQIENIQKHDYNDELSYSYQNYINDDNLHHEATNQDRSQLFNEKNSVNYPDVRPTMANPNNEKDFHRSSTSRIPFLPSNLWHDLFSKPGILVGIIGGIVIGMLSAILLVMFIIYRMRKKDEGSYALEEGPRKSPSHAYTRVSSREFFA